MFKKGKSNLFIKALGVLFFFASIAIEGATELTSYL